MEVINKEQATKEIERWLDFKRVRPQKRADQESQIETLIECVMHGTVEVDEDCFLVQNLSFGLGNDESIKQLKYKPRLSVFESQKHLKGVSASDADGRLVAYISALTNSSKNVIGQMDSEDISIGQTIALFFL